MLQLSYIIVILYSISILFFYSLAHFNLLLNYLKSKKKKNLHNMTFLRPMKSPCNHTTSIYNEKYVVERLLTTIKMDYPKHLLKFKLMTVLMIV
jgi:hypothetical protein